MISKKGLTLPEAIISLALISIAALAVFNSLENAGHLNRRAEVKSNAVNFARDAMEFTYFDYAMIKSLATNVVTKDGLTRTISTTVDSTDSYYITEVNVTD